MGSLNYINLEASVVDYRYVMHLIFFVYLYIYINHSGMYQISRQSKSS